MPETEGNRIFEDKLDGLIRSTNKLIELNQSTLGRMNGLEDEMRELTRKYEQLMDEQRRNAMLQYATTELVAVRQELEQKYGDNYNVRKTMVGVLQATDAKIVRQKTITELTEKLMVTTPNYWLAPCLIAVAAWIGNDKDLAERAIRVAMNMDAEQTAITMALICRRNGRTDSCYEWLSIYFSKQTAFKFTDVTFNYVVAYLNGVFGQDEKGKCKDYVDKWLTDIKNRHENFDAEQKEKWHTYFQNNYTCDIGQTYDALSDICTNFNDINNYAGRVYAVDSIKTKFRNIEEGQVDQIELKRSIDENLLNLVKSYAKDEGPLRREEIRLSLIKKYKGDVERAEQEIKQEEQEKVAKVVDMIQQMTNALTSEDGALPSQKMAVNFLGDYINEGFDRYINDKQEAFPKSAKIKIDGWYDDIKRAEDAPELQKSFERYEIRKRDNELALFSIKSSLGYLGISIVCIIAAILGFTKSGVLGALLLCGAVVLGVMFAISVHRNKEARQAITAGYSETIERGIETISRAAAEWERVRNDVNAFSEHYRSGDFEKLCEKKLNTEG